MIRRKLSTYADKYLDAPQLFKEEAQLAFVYAHKPFVPDAPCPLGDLTLRLFMCLFTESDKLLETIRSLPATVSGIDKDPLWPESIDARVDVNLIAV